VAKKRNNLFIRADATTSMGTGHVMRCIALAQAWKEKGGQVFFISHCENNSIRQIIDTEGFRFVAIEAPCPAPQDLEYTLKILDRNNSVQKKTLGNASGWIVIDGYHFTEAYQKSIWQSGIQLLIIDDYHHQEQYFADMILNQNIHGDQYQYSCETDAVFLLGLKYTLLRSEFFRAKTTGKKVTQKARKIMITMGGSDPDNITLKVIQAFQFINDPELAIKVVVGSSNPHLKQLKNAILNKSSNIQLIRDADMPDLMTWADLAVSAGGSTCWELFFLGVPFVTVVLAGNQEANAIFLENMGVTINLGSMASSRPEIIAKQIYTVVIDKQLRDQFRQRGSLLVDGLGATRIIHKMESLGIAMEGK